ncbi:MAG: AsmA family protein [Bdellovibrionales bacterium]|nr:AsmA family protein [Ramlibacter sp.]
MHRLSRKIGAMEPTTPPATSAAGFRMKRWQIVALSILALIVIFFLIFDWNWFRRPLEKYVSDKTQREFTISHLDVDIGWTPTIKLKDVYFANADWSKSGDPMAKIGSLEFSVSLRDMWEGKIFVPRAAMSQADLVLEKGEGDKRNWVLQKPEDQQKSSTFRISSISVDKGRLRYFDHAQPFEVDIQASTFAPTATVKVTEAKAKADNTQYTTRYSFKGKFHEAGFSGDALTGDVLSFKDSNIPFPIKGNLIAGTTRASVVGTIADVAAITAIDVQLDISGKTLANLYPFLLLPLPASPPYEFHGRLIQKGNRYGIDDLRGVIGSTDIAGTAAYVQQLPRPLLTGKLHSKLLNIADLGPLIGLETKDTKSTPTGTGTTAKPVQSETATRERAQAKERATGGNKILPTGTTAAKGSGVLPSGKFEGGRLKAIDAEVSYSAASLKAPSALPVESMKFSFSLHDAVARLTPLEFGFAGGRIVSDITIDARQEKTLRSEFNVDFRNIKVAKLFPTMPNIAKGVGELGAQIRLKGTGNSIADAAANADGSVSAAIANGRISNLIDAIAGLNGGKALGLLITGDKDIAVNCGGAYFGVKDGIGTSQLFVIDTEQTRVDGSGTFSLRDERFDMNVVPRPKKPGILSLRTPVHLYGSFRHPEFGLDKGQIALRAAATVGLALINPLTALLPLIETGGGKETDCRALLAPVQGAQLQAKSKATAAPKGSAPAPVSRNTKDPQAAASAPVAPAAPVRSASGAASSRPTGAASSAKAAAR